MTHISFSSLFRKNNMGGKTDWVGKKLTSQIFPGGKKLTGEKTDRYTGTSENCKSLVLQDKCNIEILLSPELSDYDI